MLKIPLVRVFSAFAIFSSLCAVALTAQQPDVQSLPQIQIISRTATLILTMPDGAVVKIAPNEEIPPIPLGSKISAVFGQATMAIGNYRLNLLDGGVVKPFFDKDNSRTTIIVPPESATPVTIVVGRDTAILDKGEIISIDLGSTERNVRITVVKGEVEITGSKGQFVLGEGASTSIILLEAKHSRPLGKEDKAEHPRKQEEGKDKGKTKEKKEQVKETETEKDQYQYELPSEPLTNREEASPSSP